MNQDAELRCRCGEVHGRVTNASPEAVNRIVCYCDDCQAFLHHLGRSDLLDARGGTDLVQVAPASLSFYRGHERIVGLRLAEKGLYRWYASCCKTPLGNTLGPTIPFVGIVVQAFDCGARRPDDVFGKPIGAVQGKYAIGEAPEGSMAFPVRVGLRALGMVLVWRLRGKTWPHPYFDRATRAPNRPLATLSPAERQALRALCGPHPTARSCVQRDGT
ncbi:MAG: DUF6151 family protein [Polyangiaceae bacterium]|jgi:hypothetical protein